MILKQLGLGIYLYLLSVLFLTCVSFIYCYEVPSMDEFSTKHSGSENVKSRGLTPPKPGWVDPFAMLGDSATKNNLFVQSDVDNYVLKNRLMKCETYMRRFINLFLRSITGTTLEKAPTAWVELVKLEFSISHKEFNILQEFGEHGECGDENIEVVSDLLSNILSQTFHREKSYYGMDLILQRVQTIFSKITSSPEWCVVISISVLFLTIAWLVYKQLYGAAFFMFFTTVFLCGYGFTWMRMYEEKESEKYVNHVMHGNAPYHCQGKHLVWYEQIYYRMWGTDCQQFYKIRDVRTIVKVSPTDVLIETISTMLVIPLKYIGEAYTNFIGTFTRAAPIFLQPFAYFIGLCLPILIFLLLLTFLCKYRLSISWFGVHFVPVLFQSRESVQAQTSTKYVEELSHKNDTQLPSNISCENDKPLFVVMNMLGLQKLVSKTEMSTEKCRDNVNAAAVEDSKSDKGDSEKDSNAEEANEMKQMEDLLVLLPDSKNEDQCKRRNKSVHSVTDGSSLNADTSLEDDNDWNFVSPPGGDELDHKSHDKLTECKDKSS